MDTILIKDMEFYGYHGVFEEEKISGQKFIIDLELNADLLKAGYSDRLEDSIDYACVISIVERIVCYKQYNLLEALAHNIAEEILIQFDKINRIKVRIKKNNPLIPIKFSWVAVEIERDRNGI